jgi:predicted dehydrogenase
MPGGGQYFYVYGTKGAVDVSNGRFYPLERGAQPQALSQTERMRGGEPQLAAFYECIRTGSQPVANVRIAAVAALTAILGREAIYRKKMMIWRELGVEVDLG